MKKIEKQAMRDASDWLAAELFFGDGAGNRRKLLQAKIQPVYDTNEAYREAFEKTYETLDKTKYAEAAVRERKKIDRTIKAGKNLRALKAGNMRGLSNGLFYVGAGYVFFYHTEVGKEIRVAGEKKAKVLRARAVEAYKARTQNPKIRLIREEQYASSEPVDQDAQARGMHSRGLAVADIARLLEVSEDTVRAWLHN